MRTRIVAVALLALAVLGSTVAAPAANAGNALNRSGAPFVRTWSAEWMARHGSYTQAEAVTVARSHDVVVAMRNIFKPHVAAMRAANPNLRLLVYINGTFGGNAYTESMYAHDAQGRRAEATDFRGTYMMDLNKTAWADEVAARCQSLRADSGYDGCFLDVLGSGPLMGDYMTTKPINTATGQVWTHAQWIAATKRIAERVRAVNGPVPITFNGLGAGTRYYNTDGSSAAPIVPVVDGAMPELWLRAAHNPVTAYKREVDWKKDIDMVVAIQNQGTPVTTMTKLWVTATQAQRDAWRKYSFASFLLATDGTSMFSFVEAKDTTAPTADHPWYEFDFGVPEGAYAKVGGVYRRSFTNGLALVNPTTATVMVPLDQTYVTLNGTTVTTVTMGPNTGEVLRRVGGAV